MTDTQLRNLVHAITETAPDPPSWPLTAPSRPAPVRTRPALVVAVGFALVLACVGVVFAIGQSNSDHVSPAQGAMRRFVSPSESMSPAVKAGETVQVNTTAPCCQRGQIIVFRTGPNEVWRRTGVAYLVKRVVAVPGDTISQCDQDRVCVNGRTSPERYLPEGTDTTMPDSLPYVINTDGVDVLVCDPSSPPGACTVPDGTFFVLGDNRPNSQDSRANGPIKESSVVGSVVKIR